MLKSSLCDYSDPYIPLKATVTITGDAEPPAGITDAQIETEHETMK